MMYFFRPKPTVRGVKVLGAFECNSLVLRRDRGMECRNRYWGGSGYR